MKLIFLLEEPSMKYLLDGILPRILPDEIFFQTIPHNGKRDLEKSIPRKLRGWNEPGDVRFVIVHDQDTKDCIMLKQHLMHLCENTERKVLIRISCQEMESWYFGDMCAVSKAYSKPKLLEYNKKNKYRIPDMIPTPKEELRKILPEYQQISSAKKIAPFIDIENNKSVSFQQFVKGVRRIAELDK